MTRDVSILESECGTKLVSNIPNEEDLRQQSVTDLRVYKQLKEAGKALPSLAKVNHENYLPNSIKKLARKKMSIQSNN